jgi:hypothetical protein
MKPHHCRLRGWLLPCVLGVPLVLLACGDRQSADRPAGPVTSTAPVPTNTAPANPGPVVPPSSATDIEKETGTATGMVGGASGTVASGGKPGSGTSSGGGTGAAVSSGGRTSNKK